MTRTLLGFALGMTVSAMYFGALWLTVRGIPGARHPGTLVLTSYVARLTAVGMGFYGVLRIGGARALVAALLGFLIVRQLLVFRIGRGTRGSDAEGAEWS